ncbi:MAG: hypothetical protein EHM64_02970 [Ignavibacteriae bacterium]|nr:MAG: hypothetical protein EHM64_02970 [Ignavibacteriota bacterium]
MKNRIFAFFVFIGILSIFLLSCTKDTSTIVEPQQSIVKDLPSLNYNSHTGDSYSFSLIAGAIYNRPGSVNAQEWRATFEAKVFNSANQDVRGNFNIELSVRKYWYASGPSGGWSQIGGGTCGSIHGLATSDGEWDLSQFVWQAKAHIYSTALGIDVEIIGYCYFHRPADGATWSCAYFHYDPPGSVYLAGTTVQALTVNIQGDQQIFIPGKNQGTITPQWSAAASGGQGAKTYEWYISRNNDFSLAGTGPTYSRSYSYDGDGPDSQFQLKVVVTDPTGSATCIIDVLEDRIPYSAE